MPPSAFCECIGAMNPPPAPPERGAARVGQFPSWERSGVGWSEPGSWKAPFRFSHTHGTMSLEPHRTLTRNLTLTLPCLIKIKSTIKSKNCLPSVTSLVHGEPRFAFSNALGP